MPAVIRDVTEEIGLELSMIILFRHDVDRISQAFRVQEFFFHLPTPFSHTDESKVPASRLLVQFPCKHKKTAMLRFGFFPIRIVDLSRLCLIILGFVSSKLPGIINTFNIVCSTANSSAHLHRL